MNAQKRLAGVLAAGLLCPIMASGQAEDAYPVDEAGYGVSTLENRVARLENRLAGPHLQELSGDIERLQSEVRKLRGAIEEIHNAQEKALRLQQERYDEMDARIRTLQSQSVAVTPATGIPPVMGGTAPVPETAGQMPPALLPTPVAPVSTPPVPVVDPAVRLAEYQKAFDALKAGKYTDAIAGFQTFVTRYPTGEHSDNAQFWLGEAYYVNKDLVAAQQAFRQMVALFPQSPKTADAKLKLAFIDYENGQYAQARAQLNDIVQTYPDTSAAKMADKRLERMRLESR